MNYRQVKVGLPLFYKSDEVLCQEDTENALTCEISS